MAAEDRPMTRLATRASPRIPLLKAWPRNPLAFACGVTMFGAAAAVAAMPIGSPAEAASTFGYVLAVGGSLELLAALAGVGRSPRPCVAADALLGAVSLGGAFLLLWGVPGAAASAASAAMMWLIARGVIDLLASAAMPSEHLQDGRLVRAGVDLTLGLVTAVALTVIPWWDLLFGWPGSSMRAIALFVAASFAATGLYVMAAALGRPKADPVP